MSGDLSFLECVKPPCTSAKTPIEDFLTTVLFTPSTKTIHRIWTGFITATSSTNAVMRLKSIHSNT